VIIGFGTSAPELCVSTMSGLSGHANLSLGNAYAQDERRRAEASLGGIAGG